MKKPSSTSLTVVCEYLFRYNLRTPHKKCVQFIKMRTVKLTDKLEIDYLFL